MDPTCCCCWGQGYIWLAVFVYMPGGAKDSSPLGQEGKGFHCAWEDPMVWIFSWHLSVTWEPPRYWNTLCMKHECESKLTDYLFLFKGFWVVFVESSHGFHIHNLLLHQLAGSEEGKGWHLLCWPSIRNNGRALCVGSCSPPAPLAKKMTLFTRVVNPNPFRSRNSV